MGVDDTAVFPALGASRLSAPQKQAPQKQAPQKQAAPRTEQKQAEAEAGGDADDASTVASLSLDCQDVAATVWGPSQDCPIEGLEAVFAEAKLSDCRQKILAWCREQEAADLSELQENFEELATTCELGKLPKKRFQKALNAACGIVSPW